MQNGVIELPRKKQYSSPDVVIGSNPLHGIKHATLRALTAIWKCLASCACHLLEHS